MKKSEDILESIVRLLAQKELDRIQNARRAEDHPNRRVSLFSMEELLTSLVDDLDAAKHFENSLTRLNLDVKTGGTE